MKTILYVAIMAIVLVAVILGLSYIFEAITVAELKDYSIKIGSAIVILTVAAIIVKLLVRGNSNTTTN